MITFNSCSFSGGDYLTTLKLPVEYIEPTDSINLDRYESFQTRKVVKVDDNWLAMSTTVGNYNLLFININDGDHFYAIRRGRGPGEVIVGNSFQKYGNDAVFYDMNTAICMKIRLKESVDNRNVVIDTIGRFDQGNVRPVYLAANAEGVISGNVADYSSWYCFYDFEGNIVSSIDALHYDQLARDRDFCASVHLSTKYAFNHDGTKACIASIASPSLSFAEVDKGKLKEYKRYEISAPVLGAENVSAFNDIYADDKYVYLLYSGRKLRGEEIPAYECSHVIVYDWTGNPVRHYKSDHNVSAIYMDGSVLIATSTHPESCVYTFELPLSDAL